MNQKKRGFKSPLKGKNKKIHMANLSKNQLIQLLTIDGVIVIDKDINSNGTIFVKFLRTTKKGHYFTLCFSMEDFEEYLENYPDLVEVSNNDHPDNPVQIGDYRITANEAAHLLMDDNDYFMKIIGQAIEGGMTYVVKKKSNKKEFLELLRLSTILMEITYKKDNWPALKKSIQMNKVYLKD